jgi:hypothetical protein
MAPEDDFAIDEARTADDDYSLPTDREIMAEVFLEFANWLRTIQNNGLDSL